MYREYREMYVTIGWTFSSLLISYVEILTQTDAWWQDMWRGCGSLISDKIETQPLRDDEIIRWERDLLLLPVPKLSPYMSWGHSKKLPHVARIRLIMRTESDSTLIWDLQTLRIMTKCKSNI